MAPINGDELRCLNDRNVVNKHQRISRGNRGCKTVMVRPRTPSEHLLHTPPIGLFGDSPQIPWSRLRKS